VTAQANEYSSSVLLKDNSLISRYLERTSDNRFKVNLVDVQIDLGKELAVEQIYFDQSLLVL